MIQLYFDGFTELLTVRNYHSILLKTGYSLILSTRIDLGTGYNWFIKALLNQLQQLSHLGLK